MTALSSAIDRLLAEQELTVITWVGAGDMTLFTMSGLVSDHGQRLVLRVRDLSWETTAVMDARRAEIDPDTDLWQGQAPPDSELTSPAGDRIVAEFVISGRDDPTAPFTVEVEDGVQLETSPGGRRGAMVPLPHVALRLLVGHANDVILRETTSCELDDLPAALLTDLFAEPPDDADHSPGLARMKAKIRSAPGYQSRREGPPGHRFWMEATISGARIEIALEGDTHWRCWMSIGPAGDDHVPPIEPVPPAGAFPDGAFVWRDDSWSWVPAPPNPPT